MKNSFLLLGCLVIVLLMWVFIFHLDKEQWNNGICSECGYEYKLVNSNVDKHYHRTYTFQCEKCSKIMILDFNPY